MFGTAVNLAPSLRRTWFTGNSLFLLSSLIIIKKQNRLHIKMKDRRYDQTIGIQTLTIHLYSGLFYSLFLLYIFLIWKNIVLINIHKLLVCKCIFQQLLHWCTLSLISWSRGSQHMHWNAHSFLILLQLLISRSSVVTVLELEIQLNQNRSPGKYWIPYLIQYEIFPVIQIWSLLAA